LLRQVPLAPFMGRCDVDAQVASPTDHACAAAPTAPAPPRASTTPSAWRALAIVGDSLVITDTNAVLLLRHGAR
jgi:hypothetical protein